ncbi:late cornified envelope protein 4A-like isoform X1 [Mangifera indica]|uniref:late cornified envelope protein 4A-like isoform X1 n=1 Tax=Mangifera indica TaxID=29780 RepID=UPI001CF9D52A|nr:late cornified envelope protein 4A-like isoform X1 [Mangifera indica]
MGEKKVVTMVLKVDLQCEKCYRKVKKVLCSFPQIQDQVYDEKQNTVTIKVVCCSPEKIKQKLCCKGIKFYCPPPPPRTPPPPPPPPPPVCCGKCQTPPPVCCGKCQPPPPVCCGKCYLEIVCCSVCYHEPLICYGGYYGRPVYDSWGGGSGGGCRIM